MLRKAQQLLRRAQHLHLADSPLGVYLEKVDKEWGVKEWRPVMKGVGSSRSPFPWLRAKMLVPWRF